MVGANVTHYKQYFLLLVLHINPSSDYLTSFSDAEIDLLYNDHTDEELKFNDTSFSYVNDAFYMPQDIIFALSDNEKKLMRRFYTLLPSRLQAILGQMHQVIVFLWKCSIVEF